MSKISRLRYTLKRQHPVDLVATDPAPGRAPEGRIAELVAEVYVVASPNERGRLLEQLLRPLGVLSLVAIADGIFASMRFRSGWEALHIRLEDLHDVRAAHVIALVEHAQQVSVEAVDGLAQLLVTSPMLMSSAAAAALVSVLLARAHAAGRPPLVPVPGGHEGRAAALADPGS